MNDRWWWKIEKLVNRSNTLDTDRVSGSFFLDKDFIMNKHFSKFQLFVSSNIDQNLSNDYKYVRPPLKKNVVFWFRSCHKESIKRSGEVCLSWGYLIGFGLYFTNNWSGFESLIFIAVFCTRIILVSRRLSLQIWHKNNRRRNLLNEFC